MALKLSFDQVALAFSTHGLELLAESYVNSKTPLPYRCKVCGHVGEKPYGSVRACEGCPSCWNKRRQQPRKHSLQEAGNFFAERQLELLASSYRNPGVPLPYRCLVCGFEGKLRLTDVMQKACGCRICGIRRRGLASKLDFEEFRKQQREQGIEVSPAKYENVETRVEACCLVCHFGWVTTVNCLRSGRGCRKCKQGAAVKRRTYTNEFVANQLAKKGISLISSYSTSQKPIRVRFEACGHENTSTWNQLQRGDRCPRCAPNARLTDEDYLEAVHKHGGKLLVKARKGSLPSLWQCCLGHEFHRSLLSIRSLGTFCTDCSGSYGEMLCRTVVERLFGRTFRRVRMRGMISSKGVPLELDIYSEELKLAVEHNGAHHYEPQENWNGLEGFRLQQLNDRTRRRFCKANGILLIEVRELGKRTTVEEMREQIHAALSKGKRSIPHGFAEADLINLPVVNESEVYWRGVAEKAATMGFEILTKVFLGADKPLSVRCSHGHITRKTPRSILQGHQCDECYMEARKKPLRLSDGRVFESGAAAAKVIGVTKEVVNKAIRQGRRLKGFSIERISWAEFRRSEESRR